MDKLKIIGERCKSGYIPEAILFKRKNQRGIWDYILSDGGAIYGRMHYIWDKVESHFKSPHTYAFSIEGSYVMMICSWDPFRSVEVYFQVLSELDDIRTECVHGDSQTKEEN